MSHKEFVYNHKMALMNPLGHGSQMRTKKDLELDQTNFTISLNY